MNRNRLLITIPIIVFIGVIYFLRDLSKEIEKTPVVKSPKITKVKSRQKIVQTKNKVIISKLKSSVRTKNISSKINNKKLKYSTKPLLDKYFNVIKGDYKWSNHIFAIHKENVNKGNTEIYGHFGDMLFVEQKGKKDKNYYLIKTKDSKKVSFYTGKVILINNKHKPVENIERFLSSSKIKWKKLSGTYILEIEDVLQAVIIKTELAEKYDVKVDLDLNDYPLVSF